MPDDEDSRLATARKQAEVATAEADAEKTRAEADKARAEADKSEAEARSAAAKAHTDEVTAAEHDSAAARRQRDAEADKATAVANKDAAAARQAQISALVPDLSKIKESSLEVTGDVALWGTMLAYRALDSATTTLVKELPGDWRNPPSEPRRLLVTSDSMLVNSDSLYQDVSTGLDQLIGLAGTVLGTKERAEEEALATDVVGALAAAVPSVLSLFSAQRTVTTKAITVSDQAAAAAAAGAILEACKGNISVVHDDFRLVPKTGIYRRSKDLSEKRGKLLVAKAKLTAEKSRADWALEENKTSIAELKQKLKDATDDASKALLEKKIKETEEKQPGLIEVSDYAAARLSMRETALGAIDTFTTALTTVAAGSQRSPLAAAALRELLHQTPRGADGRAPENLAEDMSPFSHVLLVRAEAGSSQQVVSKRPLWWRDRFSTAATVTVTYMLIQTGDSSIVAAGAQVGTATAHGQIGSDIQVSLERPRQPRQPLMGWLSGRAARRAAQDAEDAQKDA